VAWRRGGDLFVFVEVAQNWQSDARSWYLHSSTNFPMGGLMATVKVTIKPNGPFVVEAPAGAIDLVDASGNKYDLSGKPAFALCRCGGSVNKPFCDGTHSKIGFQGAELAVKKADG
jgi:CDGSH-type Zn-finger protein